MIQVTETNEIHLSTKNTSYIIGVLPSGHVSQLYYGKRIREKGSYENLYMNYSVSVGCQTAYSVETGSFTQETTRLEVSSSGKGDYKTPSIELVTEDGQRTLDFQYDSHKVLKGKKSLEGLPATFQNDDLVDSLEITLVDSVLDIELVLSYSSFYERDVITRSIRIINGEAQGITIDSIMSMNLDFHVNEFDMLTLNGEWIKERHVEREKVRKGIFKIDSKKGVSGSKHSPFIALLEETATEHQGEVYGFSLVYSGNHQCLVERSPMDMTRVQLGINPFDFSWKLEKKQDFQTPEVLMTYSDQGLNGMSQNFHNMIQHNLVSKEWQFKERPILINNWEATYFDFTERKLLKLAKEAKNVGVELFVLDDGWFLGRNNDKTSLGDWSVDKSKLPDGLVGFQNKLEDMGLKFGLWVEPEMVSVESQLYKKHPDWAIQLPERSPSFGRNQLILDLANQEVVDYLYRTLSSLFKESKVSYIKWDMNRNFSDLYSNSLPKDQQKEHGHRYVLGLYQLLEDLKKDFPNILFESCASGGNRFDLGMLYYMPQTWTSDNTDALERMKIQYGTSMVFPPSTMGAHVSGAPSHQVLRKTPIETRFNVAAFGLLGYEYDLTETSAFEKKVIKKQIDYYKEHRQLFQFGKFYRIDSPFENNCFKWQVLARDQSESIVGYYQQLQESNKGLEKIKMKGLREDKEYTVESRQMSFNIEKFGGLVNEISPVKMNPNGVVHKVVSNHYELKSEIEKKTGFGDEFMKAGMWLLPQFIGTEYNEGVRFIGDFGSRLYYIKKL